MTPGVVTDNAGLSADALPAPSRARTWYEYVVDAATALSVADVPVTVVSKVPLRYTS